MSDSGPNREPAGPGPAERRDLADRLLRHAGEVADGVRAGRSAAGGLQLVGTGRGLLEEAESAMRILVGDARRAGSPWRALGEVMGTTRQAAQQRFGERGEGVGGEEALRRVARWAVMVVSWWQRGQLKEVRSAFDPRLAERLNESQLAAAWAQVQAARGPLQGQDDPAVARRGPLLLVDIPLRFERGPMKARVALAEGGAVTGLFLLDPGAP